MGEARRPSGQMPGGREWCDRWQGAISRVDVTVPSALASVRLPPLIKPHHSWMNRQTWPGVFWHLMVNYANLRCECRGANDSRRPSEAPTPDSPPHFSLADHHLQKSYPVSTTLAPKRTLGYSAEKERHEGRVECDVARAPPSPTRGERRRGDHNQREAVTTIRGRLGGGSFPSVHMANRPLLST